MPWSGRKVAVLAAVLLSVVPLASARCSWAGSDASHKNLSGCEECVTSASFRFLGIGRGRACAWCPTTGACQDPSGSSDCTVEPIRGTKLLCSDHFDKLKRRRKEEEEERAKKLMVSNAIRSHPPTQKQQEFLTKLEELRNGFKAVLHVDHFPVLQHAFESLLTNVEIKNEESAVTELCTLLKDKTLCTQTNRGKVYNLLAHAGLNLHAAIDTLFKVVLVQKKVYYAASSAVKAYMMTAVVPVPGPERDADTLFRMLVKGLEMPHVEDGVRNIIHEMQPEGVELSEYGRLHFREWCLHRAISEIRQADSPCDRRGNMKDMEAGLQSLAEIGEMENLGTSNKQQIFIWLEIIVAIANIGLMYIPIAGPFISFGTTMAMQLARKKMDFEGDEDLRVKGIEAHKGAIRSMEAMTVATMLHYDHFVYPYAFAYSKLLDDFHAAARKEMDSASNSDRAMWKEIMSQAYNDKQLLIDDIGLKHKKLEGYSKTAVLAEEVNYLHMLSDSEGTKAKLRVMERVKFWLESASMLAVTGVFISHLPHLVASIEYGVLEGKELNDAAKAHHLMDQTKVIGNMHESAKLLFEYGHTVHHLLHSHGHSHGHHEEESEMVDAQGSKVKTLREQRTRMCEVIIQDMSARDIAAVRPSPFAQVLLREANGKTLRMRETTSREHTSEPEWPETFTYAGVMLKLMAGEPLLTVKVWDDTHLTVGEWHSRAAIRSDESLKVGTADVRLTEEAVRDMLTVGEATMKVDTEICEELRLDHKGHGCVAQGRISFTVVLKNDVKRGPGAELMSLEVDIEKVENLPSAGVFHTDVYVEGRSLDLDFREQDHFETEPARGSDGKAVWNEHKTVACALLSTSGSQAASGDTDVAARETDASLYFELVHKQRDSTRVDIGEAVFVPEWPTDPESATRLAFDQGDVVTLADRRGRGYLPVKARGQEGRAARAAAEGARLYVTVKAQRIDAAAQSDNARKKIYEAETRAGPDTAKSVAAEDKNHQVMFATRMLAAMWYSGVAGITMVDQTKQTSFISAGRLQDGLIRLIEADADPAKVSELHGLRRLVAMEHNAHSWETLFDDATNAVRSSRFEITIMNSAHIVLDTASLNGAPCKELASGVTELMHYRKVECTVPYTLAGHEEHAFYVRAQQDGHWHGFRATVPSTRGVYLAHATINLDDRSTVKRFANDEQLIDTLVFPSPFAYLSRPPSRDPEMEKIILAYHPIDGVPLPITKTVNAFTLDPTTELQLYENGWVKASGIAAVAGVDEPTLMPLLWIGRNSPVRSPVGWEQVAAIPRVGSQSLFTTLWVPNPPPGYRCFGSVAVESTLSGTAFDALFTPPPLSAVGCVPLAASKVWDRFNTEEIALLDSGTATSDTLANALSSSLHHARPAMGAEVRAEQMKKQEYRLFRGPQPLSQMISTAHNTDASFPARAVFTLNEDHVEVHDIMRGMQRAFELDSQAHVTPPRRARHARMTAEDATAYDEQRAKAVQSRRDAEKERERGLLTLRRMKATAASGVSSADRLRDEMKLRGVFPRSSTPVENVEPRGALGVQAMPAPLVEGPEEGME